MSISIIYSRRPQDSRVCRGKKTAVCVSIQRFLRHRRADSQKASCPRDLDLSDGLLWLPTSRRTANFRQVARHGDMWACRAGKLRTHEQARANSLVAFIRYLSLNLVDSSPRYFLMALHLCPSSAGPAVGPQDDCHWVSSYKLRMESKQMPARY